MKPFSYQMAVQFNVDGFCFPELELCEKKILFSTTVNNILLTINGTVLVKIISWKISKNSDYSEERKKGRNLIIFYDLPTGHFTRSTLSSCVKETNALRPLKRPYMRWGTIGALIYRPPLKLKTDLNNFFGLRDKTKIGGL